MVGHAVRAMYLYSGMADVAGETGDETLLAACERLWEDVTARKMYVTGGVGLVAATTRASRTTYDLPNEIGLRRDLRGHRAGVLGAPHAAARAATAATPT